MCQSMNNLLLIRVNFSRHCSSKNRKNMNEVLNFKVDAHTHFTDSIVAKVMN